MCGKRPAGPDACVCHQLFGIFIVWLFMLCGTFCDLTVMLFIIYFNRLYNNLTKSFSGLFVLFCCAFGNSKENMGLQVIHNTSWCKNHLVICYCKRYQIYGAFGMK